MTFAIFCLNWAKLLSIKMFDFSCFRLNDTIFYLLVKRPSLIGLAWWSFQWYMRPIQWRIFHQDLCYAHFQHSDLLLQIFQPISMLKTSLIVFKESGHGLISSPRFSIQLYLKNIFDYEFELLFSTYSTSTSQNPLINS